MREALAKHGGREEGTEGDSFFVVFDNALEAVGAAVDAQRALAAEPWPPGAEVNVRMGLHAGEASTSAAGLVGLDVNRAARIAAAAHGGQVVVSEAVRALVTPDLGEGISLRGLGSHRLKDLREPQPLCQVVADGLRMEFPPLCSLDARPNNLPTQLTSFVGRERELEEAGGLLEREPHRHPHRPRRDRQDAARRSRSRRTPPSATPTASSSSRSRRSASRPSSRRRIASAIGLAETGARSAGRRPPRVARRQARSCSCLDNFEQVLDAGPVVADLLRDVPSLRRS